MQVLMDRSISVRESVYDVQETLLIAIGLVILVIFLFLRTVSATIIPALAVPISLIATCAVMYAFNFSINNMTLLALTLSVGFVVDDAIVMLENIVRHIEGGMRPFEAALKGAREIGFTIISITVSLIAVFIPVLLMGGMVGRVFREFAVTIAVAIIVSGFVSLTLTPMLCARVLRTHHEGEKQNVVLRAVRARCSIRGSAATNGPSTRCCKYKSITLMVTLATMAGTVYLYIVIPKGFFPVEDTGYRLGHGRRTGRYLVPRDARAPAGDRRDGRGRTRRSITSTPRSASAGRTRPTIPAACSSVLKPQSERDSIGGRAAAACAQTANVVGMAVYFRGIQNINLGGRISKGEFQYTMQSSETETLYRVSRRDARQDQDDRGPARRQQRSLHQESGDRDRDRSREGGVLRHLGRPDPPGALQRVRQSPGRHDLYADQRLPDHPGDAAGVPGRHDAACRRSISRPVSPTPPRRSPPAAA